MQSTLFTTLTSTEEANLSGGSWKKYVKKYEPKKEDKPAEEKKPGVLNLGINFSVINQTQALVGKNNVGVQNAEVTQTNSVK